MTRVRQAGGAQRRGDGQDGSRAGVTTFVPLQFKRHGVRKLIVHAEPEEGTPGQPMVSRADPLVVKAIAQGLYWQSLLHANKASDAAEIARVEGTDRARVTKITKLALLAPDVIAAIVEGRLQVSLRRLLRDELSADWSEQRVQLGVAKRPGDDSPFGVEAALHA